MGSKVGLYIRLILTYTLTTASGESPHGMQKMGYNDFSHPDPDWCSVPNSFRPPGVGTTRPDPHPEAAYLDQQHFPVNAERKSAGGLSQGNPGQSRVQRAVRQRSYNSIDKGQPPKSYNLVEKGPPPRRTSDHYPAGQEFPDRLDPVPETLLEYHPPLVLQYPPADSQPGAAWWQ